jgi:hypothetical protein
MSLKFTGLAEIERSFRTAAAAMGKAEARAVRRVGVTIAANQAREIAKTENLKLGTIKDAIKTVAQPTPDQPRVVFEVRAKAIGLEKFIGSRVTKKGLSVQPLKTGQRAVLRAGFAFKRGGAYFGRAAKSGKQYGSPHVDRTPIVRLFGPNVLSQYIKDAVQQAGDDTWATRLPIELERESNFALKQAGLL